MKASLRLPDISMTASRLPDTEDGESVQDGNFHRFLNPILNVAPAFLVFCVFEILS